METRQEEVENYLDKLIAVLKNDKRPKKVAAMIVVLDSEKESVFQTGTVTSPTARLLILNLASKGILCSMLEGEEFKMAAKFGAILEDILKGEKKDGSHS